MSAGGMASNVLVRSANAEIYLLQGTNLIGMQSDMRKNHPTKLELLGRIRKNQLSLQVNQFSLQ